MAKNKMSEVAKLLGVELEEEFRLEGVPYRCELTECGLFIKRDDEKSWHVSTLLESLLTGKYQIVKLQKPILDDVEREYLGNIIKPFRDRIISIGKYRHNQDEYIGMYVNYYAETGDSEMIKLPVFKEGTMYNCMELDREYTLEELGL